MTLSRRQFLLGSAALSVPLSSPALVMWFEKWFRSRKYWDMGRYMAMDPGFGGETFWIHVRIHNGGYEVIDSENITSHHQGGLAIRDALDRVAPGGTIEVAPGHHEITEPVNFPAKRTE